MTSNRNRAKALIGIFLFTSHLSAMDIVNRNVVGKGNFSEVHDASPLQSSILKAKQLIPAVRKHSLLLQHEEFINERNLLREASILHTIRGLVRSTRTGHHVHIPRVDLKSSTSHCIKMEKAKGLILSDIIFKLTPNDFLALMKNIMETVLSIHDVGFAHEDLNLTNILVNPRDVSDFMIIDFGMAGQIDVETRLHPPHPSIAAPEMKLLGTINPKADVYALGRICLAYFTALSSRNRDKDFSDDIENLMMQMLYPIESRISLTEAIMAMDDIIANKENSLMVHHPSSADFYCAHTVNASGYNNAP